MRNQFWAFLFVFAALLPAHADATLLLEEPYGRYGSLNPTGHAAVYLTQVCAASPTQLRRCEAGEAGVVISRYRKIAGYDWLAIPLLPYLYAVDNLPDVPQTADAQLVATLRDRYRREHLLALAPDDAGGKAPKGEWTQLVGSAYDRRIYGFQIETTPEKDAELIEQFNQRENRSHFNLFYSNCADFAGSILNFYAPHAVHRNLFADAGFTTPKQIAKSFARYARHHPVLEYSSFQIPQVPGSIQRSRSVDGIAEALLKSKKYLVPLAFFNPAVTGSIAVVYFTEGRFNPKRNAGVFDLARALQPPPPRVTTPSAVTDHGAAAAATPSGDLKPRGAAN